jgi:hypothetical protein
MRASADYGSIVRRIWELLNDTEENTAGEEDGGLAARIAPSAQL